MRGFLHQGLAPTTDPIIAQVTGGMGRSLMEHGATSFGSRGLPGVLSAAGLPSSSAAAPPASAKGAGETDAVKLCDLVKQELPTSSSGHAVPASSGDSSHAEHALPKPAPAEPPSTEKKRPSGKQIFEAKQAWKTQVALWRTRICESSGKVAAALSHVEECTTERDETVEMMSGKAEYDDTEQQAMVEQAVAQVQVAKEHLSS